MTIETATVLFLIILFGAAEIYRFRRGKRGVIVAVDESSLAQAMLPVFQVRVRLNDGPEVTAALNGCVACLGRLKIGDEVKVCDSRDGLVIDLAWFRKSRCDCG